MGQSQKTSLGFIEEFKIETMNYDEIIKSIKDILEKVHGDYTVSKFEEILNNYKKFHNNQKFPHRNLKEIYRKKKLNKYFDAIVETKLQYFTIFKSYYDKSSYGPFKDIFKETKNYDELLIEQNNYLKYKELEKTYTKKIKVK